MDRSGFFLLLGLIAVAMIPIVDAIRSGAAIVGATAVACCIVGAAGWALVHEVRLARQRRASATRMSRRERDPALWS